MTTQPKFADDYSELEIFQLASQSLIKHNPTTVIVSEIKNNRLVDSVEEAKKLYTAITSYSTKNKYGENL
jgi:hypothetical protein